MVPMLFDSKHICDTVRRCICSFLEGCSWLGIVLQLAKLPLPWSNTFFSLSHHSSSDGRQWKMSCHTHISHWTLYVLILCVYMYGCERVWWVKTYRVKSETSSLFSQKWVQTELLYVTGRFYFFKILWPIISAIVSETSMGNVLKRWRVTISEPGRRKINMLYFWERQYKHPWKFYEKPMVSLSKLVDGGSLQFTNINLIKYTIVNRDLNFVWSVTSHTQIWMIQM